MFKKIPIWVLVIVVAAAAGGYWYFAKPNVSPTLKHATVEKRDLTESLELSGKVTAEKFANLHFLAGGLVTYAPFQEGNTVKKWATIARLDTRQLNLALKQQLNLFASSRADFDTTQDTYTKQKNDGDVNQALRRILEKTQYTLDNSVINVELQDLSLKLSSLTSPIDGILVKSPIKTANVYVSAADNFQIVDPTTLTFTADLDESDLSKIKEGMAAHIILDAYPDINIASTVERIAYSAKETTTGTTYEVTVHLPEDVIKTLRLGLNGTVAITRETHVGALVLPIEAVTETGKAATVNLENSDKSITVKNVKLGASDNTNVEITEGLASGDTVVYGK
ncbi:MAG: efflux RND transporter periplasmic adaptor subunit [bacterium]